MKRLISILRENNIECLPNERFTLDVEMFSESEEEYHFPRNVLFENPGLRLGKKWIEPSDSSILRFFLDGSQRSYRVIDASFDHRYLPICAGQIGVAVLERDDRGRLFPRRDLTIVQNIITMPDILEEDNVRELEEKINREMTAQFQFCVKRYKVDDDKDPADLGRAKIIHEMQKLELETIRNMIQAQEIREKMLVKDGGLQYRDSKVKELGLSNEDRIQLRNVIGVAKTFQPSMTIGKGRARQDLGNITKGLGWKERTTVISPDKEAQIAHGWWYLRLRPPQWMYSPLQGIAKIEIFASDEEKNNNGVHEARADTISSYILNERNVTPYNADTRWASHIYPIYLSEKYLRSSFLSHVRFKALIL